MDFIQACQIHGLGCAKQVKGVHKHENVGIFITTTWTATAAPQQ